MNKPPNAEIDGFVEAVNEFSRAGADRYTGVNVADAGSAYNDTFRRENLNRISKLVENSMPNGSGWVDSEGRFHIEVTGTSADIPGVDSTEDVARNLPDIFDGIEHADQGGGSSPRVRSSGSITAIHSSLWERTWGSPEVQHVMRNTITGKLVGGIANFMGTGVSAFRTDGYNPATLKHVHGANKIHALQDTVISLATLPLGGGGTALTRAEIAGVKSAMQRQVGGVRTALQGVQPQQPLLLTYTPTTNTLSQIRRMPFPERWQAAETYAQELYGSAGQQHFSVPAGNVAGEKIRGTGGRFVDVPVPMASGGTFAGEVKLYKPWRTVNGQRVQHFVPLTEQLQQQVLKDVWLRNNVFGYDPRWLFLDALPSSDLSRYLMHHRIDHVIHH